MTIQFQENKIIPWLNKHQAFFIELSDQIWGHPEILWQEKFASGLLSDYLESQGFSMTRNPSGMETAFVAEWGSGSPVIAFVGEYDALPGLSNVAEPVKKAVVEGGHGHGCGHNMLGVASAAAAAVARVWMEANDVSGTIRYYGTPAEEGGGSKVFMARDGLFNDIDAALTYHPNFINMPSKSSNVAITASKFRFHGKSAHAGSRPHLGRSALDAVELMNVGANYMREHVLDGTRIQYVITDGGQAANIVPETAEVHYILRAAKPEYLFKLADRLRNIAKGAALMTDTTFDEKVECGYVNMLNNHIITDIMYEALQAVGPIEYTAEELEFAQKINDSFGKTNEDLIEQKIEITGINDDGAKLLRMHADQPVLGANFPALDNGFMHKFATDVSDLSQVAPTSTLNTACFPTSSPGHSWVNTACGGMSIGHKGMMHAAKALALTAVPIFSDPELVKHIRAEFDERMAGKTYKPIIPEGMQPGD